eukprot:403351941
MYNPAGKNLKRMSTYSNDDKSSSFSFTDNPKQLKNLQQFYQQNALPEYFDETKVEFHELNNCEICYIKFNTTHRRHHCRRCGKSVCGKCSNNEKPLSRSDQKKLYRVCDQCDTELQNFTLKKNLDDILTAQKEQIDILNVQIEEMDEVKTNLKMRYENEKQLLRDKLQRTHQKKNNLESEVVQLSKDLERLNNNRIALHTELGMQERQLSEKENQKNQMISEKFNKLNELGEKEKVLHEKQQKNEELKQHLDQQKQKFKKLSGISDDNGEELKNSTLSSQNHPQNNGNVIDDEERLRLDRLRNEKFKFIENSMANHRIEESTSEYNSSFLSIHDNRRGTQGKSIVDNNNRRSGAFGTQITDQPVEEVDEDQESERSKNYDNPNHQNKSQQDFSQMQQNSKQSSSLLVADTNGLNPKNHSQTEKQRNQASKQQQQQNKSNQKYQDSDDELDSQEGKQIPQIIKKKK